MRTPYECRLTPATKISTEILGQVLALLVKAMVLVNEEKDQYDLNPGALYPLCLHQVAC
jgi:hypothetical protein